MEQQSHCYEVEAWWSAGRSGILKSSSAPNSLHFTAPLSFGGMEGRWTPEDMLLGALASCYVTTFRVLAEYHRWDYADLLVKAEGIADKARSGYCFTKIVLHPKLQIWAESERPRATELLKKAESLCLVSRALEVVPSFEPQVEVVKPAPAGKR